MRAIVHIGTEKTGTTSFQNFMHANRDRLAAKNVLYPQRLGHMNHRHIASYGLCLEAADESMKAMGIDTQEKLEEFYRNVETTLQEQLESSVSAEICIISSEHLHSRLTSTQQIQRIKDLIQGHFEDIDVHIHLRPQVDVAISLASTQSRVGGAVTRGFFNQANKDRMYYNYDMLVGTWEKVFGAENITCVAFREFPDYLSWLTSKYSLDLSDLLKPDRTNEALDVRTIAMVNALVESGSPQRINFSVLDILPVEQKLTLDEAFARQIQHRFEESNRTLIDRRDDLRPGQLQPNWSKFPEHGTFSILEQPCAFSAQLASLVSHYNKVIQEAQKN